MLRKKFHIQLCTLAWTNIHIGVYGYRDKHEYPYRDTYINAYVKLYLCTGEGGGREGRRRLRLCRINCSPLFVFSYEKIKN